MVLTYLIWEIYWYNKVGYYFIKWHTHLMPYAGIFFFIYLIEKYILKDKLKNGIRWVYSIALFMLVLELLLMITGTTKTFSEKTYGSYISPFKSTYSQDYYYHTWDHSTPTHTLSTPEFSFTYPTNSLGYPDVEWSQTKKDPHALRIVTLGDSFTEGDGAAYDSNYVAHLKRKLSADSCSYEILNAGVCGSDPAFNFVNLRDRIIHYNPNMVIQMISSPDILHDFATRGGLERFKSNKIMVNNPPWWEPIYAMSYTSRILFRLIGYGEQLIKSKRSKDDLIKITEAVFSEYISFCDANKIKLIIVVRPEIDELKQGKYAYDFNSFETYIRSLSKEATVINLLPSYQQTLSITNTSANDYYWQKDRHHNAKGYKMLADGIYDALRNEICKNTTRTPQN